jgi:hypothetical protein
MPNRIAVVEHTRRLKAKGLMGEMQTEGPARNSPSTVALQIITDSVIRAYLDALETRAIYQDDAEFARQHRVLRDWLELPPQKRKPLGYNGTFESWRYLTSIVPLEATF